jgi:hypothetical protein
MSFSRASATWQHSSSAAATAGLRAVYFVRGTMASLAAEAVQGSIPAGSPEKCLNGQRDPARPPGS